MGFAISTKANKEEREKFLDFFKQEETLIKAILITSYGLSKEEFDAKYQGVTKNESTLSEDYDGLYFYVTGMNTSFIPSYYALMAWISFKLGTCVINDDERNFHVVIDSKLNDEYPVDSSGITLRESTKSFPFSQYETDFNGMRSLLEVLDYRFYSL
jgi:hypothetical protein